MPIHSLSTAGQAGKFFSGMTGNVLLAVAFHAAVGSALWLGGWQGEARPAYPVADVIMIEVIPAPRDMETPVFPVVEENIAHEPEPQKEPDPLPEPEPELVLEPEPEPEPAPEPEQKVVVDNVRPEDKEESVLTDVPVFELPVKKPVPTDVSSEDKPIDTAQETKKTDQVPDSRKDKPVSAPLSRNYALPRLPPGSPANEQVAQSSPLQATRVTYARNPKPLYPEEARRRRLEGVVMLFVTVGIDGRALSVTIKKSSGHRILDRAAKMAITAWRFVPATIGGIPVESTAEVPVRFSLQDT